MLRITPVLLLFISLVSAGQVNAADDAAGERQWGNLTATFRYDGEPPPRQPLLVDKDQGVFKDRILDPALIVDSKSKGIANVIVWLYLAPEQELPAIHASYKEQATEEVVTETRGGMIVPHVTLLWTSQKLVIKNSDLVGHDRKMDLLRNTLGCDLLIPNAVYSRQLPRREGYPVPMGCNIHPWESGYILVRDNPYMAVSDREGKLVIKNLSAGEHTFALWHEKVGYLSEAKRGGKVEKIPKGRLTVVIKPGENEMGEFLIKPK